MKKSKKLILMMIEIGGTVQKDRNPETAKEGWKGPVSSTQEGKSPRSSKRAGLTLHSTRTLGPIGGSRNDYLVHCEINSGTHHFTVNI